MLIKGLFIILNLFIIDSFLLSNVCINRYNNIYKLNMLYDKDFAEAISKPNVFVEEEKDITPNILIKIHIILLKIIKYLNIRNYLDFLKFFQN